jgi:copper homeostasis protein (lipoprotein)
MHTLPVGWVLVHLTAIFPLLSEGATMQTLIKNIKHLPAVLVMAFLCIGYNPAFAETDVDAGEQHAQKILNLSGLYLGYYPCSDCRGIRTTLALNKNNTYVYISLYVGKSDREFVEKGKFSLGENGDKLILTPKKGSTTVQEYLIEDDMLIKLDEDGNRITKDGADGYILKRKDVMKGPEGSGHAGH